MLFRSHLHPSHLLIISVGSARISSSGTTTTEPPPYTARRRGNGCGVMRQTRSRLESGRRSAPLMLRSWCGLDGSNGDHVVSALIRGQSLRCAHGPSSDEPIARVGSNGPLRRQSLRRRTATDCGPTGSAVPAGSVTVWDEYDCLGIGVERDARTRPIGVCWLACDDPAVECGHDSECHAVHSGTGRYRLPPRWGLL